MDGKMKVDIVGDDCRSRLDNQPIKIEMTSVKLNENLYFLHQYKMLLDESSIVSKADVNGLITYANDAFCKISGYTRGELIGKNHSIVRHTDTPTELFKDMWETIKSGRIWKNTFKNRSKSGEDYYVKSVIAPIFNETGVIDEYIAARIDVTELIHKDQIIERQLIDELTGLRNRNALFTDLKNGAENTTLALVNIDHFSDVNDYFGYEVGDKLLKAIAEYLDNAIYHTSIYRISGDEFAFICINHEYNDFLKETVTKHIANLEKCVFKIADNEISVNISCGVAYAKKWEIYNLAHIALKEAKGQQGKIIFFNDNQALKENNKNNIIIVNKIKSAIAEDRIVPYFQGIVDNRTRRIVKYEGLIRLIESDGTVLSPFFFLEHAKRSKLYDTLTRIMITKIFEVFEDSEYEFSINLTLQDILSDKTRNFLFDTAKKSSASNRLVLEIVESERIESFEEVAEFINEIKKYGCKIAIDDFGSGYSNFSYLSKLNIDFLKIDGSLVKNINRDGGDLYTIESILHFAKKMGIKTIAEFVEDEAMFAKLKELDIDYSQGYLFSVPAPSILSYA